MDKYSKKLLDGSLEQFDHNVVPKIPVFVGEDINSEVYYFNPNQVLKTHRHPAGEQIFIFLKGSGEMKLGESKFHVSEGSTIFVPRGEWHEITNGKEVMVTVQVTKVGAGAEYKNI